MGLQRDRWCGPGVVALQLGHTVWVGMRSKLWKCNVDQVREATHPESLGAELLKEGSLADLTRWASLPKHHGGIDVAREGSPPDDAWDQPVTRDDTGAGTEAGPPLDVVQVGSDSVTLPDPPGPPDLDDDGEAMAEVEPQRMEESTNSEVTGSRVARSSSSSSESDASSVSSDKAVSEAKRRRLEIIPEESSTSRTPVEELDVSSGRVLRQVAEIESPSQGQDLPAEIESHETPSSGSRSKISHGIDTDELWSEMSFFLSCHDERVTFVTNPNKSGEVNYHRLTPEEKKSFDASDAKEWSSIVATKAVRVLPREQGDLIRVAHPERVVTSRMVRRWKPQPGLHSAPLAKSRWCVHGHQDPDAGLMKTYSPTPKTEAICAFLHVAA